MKPPVSSTRLQRLLDLGVSARWVHPRRRCRGPRRRFGYAACRETAIARLKRRISRLCDMVQRFSTVVPPELYFSSDAVFSVVSHVTICLPSRLSLASCSRQATCSNLQFLLLTADASAELPRGHIEEAPLTPVEHLDASSWRHRRAVNCESEVSMVMRMLELDTKAFDDEDVAGCGASSRQTQLVRQLKWYRGSGSVAAGGSRNHRPNPRQQLKYRMKRRSQQQQQQWVMLDESQQILPAGGCLQQPDAVAGATTTVGTTWDLAPLSDITYTSSLKQEPLIAEQIFDMETVGNTCGMSGPSTQDSAFFTCSSNLTAAPLSHETHGPDADLASRDELSPSRRTLRKRCTAMTERLRSALVSAEVIPSRIRELLSEAVDLVAPGAPGILQDCSVSVDTLNCVDLGDAAKNWDLIACETLQASTGVAVTCSMGDCSRGVPVQGMLQQQQQQTLEWDHQPVGPGRQNAADSTRRHNDRRQRQLFKLTRKRRKTNTLD